jgi:hypothetical protein
MNNFRGLNKSERRKLKKQRRREILENERKTKTQNKIKTIMKFLIPVIIIIIVGSFFVNLSLADAPRIHVSPNYYDFGEVVAGGDIVSALMDVTNTGKNDLVINNMDSSCGCTSASMVVNGEEGPRFSMSMHGTNPRDWSVIINPGKTAQLKIYYDPSVHRDLKGHVTRYITLFSNDPLSSQLQIKIEANQI